MEVAEIDGAPRMVLYIKRWDFYLI
uniref:Uncharacterized protein n=1 Tax=Arundo donax TaxID=35708 RepID=A0A0A8XN14_ARUDO